MEESGIVSCSHLSVKHKTLHSIKDFRFFTRAASSSILLSSNPTLAITIEGSYGVCLIFPSLLFIAAVLWCLNPTRLPRRLNSPPDPRVLPLISLDKSPEAGILTGDYLTYSVDLTIHNHCVLFHVNVSTHHPSQPFLVPLMFVFIIDFRVRELLWLEA